MAEGYTSTAGRILARASREARLLGHTTTDTGHLVLSIAAEHSTPAAAVLRDLGVTEPALRAAARKYRPARAAVPRGRPVFTWRLRRVLRRAVELGPDRIGPEHLLLALVQEDRGTGARALASVGASAARVRTATRRLVAGDGAAD